MTAATIISHSLVQFPRPHQCGKQVPIDALARSLLRGRVPDLQYIVLIASINAHLLGRGNSFREFGDSEKPVSLPISLGPGCRLLPGVVWYERKHERGDS